MFVKIYVFFPTNITYKLIYIQDYLNLQDYLKNLLLDLGQTVNREIDIRYFVKF